MIMDSVFCQSDQINKAKEKNISVSGFLPDPAQKGRPKIFFLIILF